MSFKRKLKRLAIPILATTLTFSAIGAVSPIFTTQVQAADATTELTQQITPVVYDANALNYVVSKLFTVNPDGTVMRWQWESANHQIPKNPQLLSGLSDVKYVYHHDNESRLYVVKSDNQLYLYNWSTYELKPVVNGNDIVKLSLNGSSDIYALKSDGTVWLMNNGTNGFIKHPTMTNVVDISGTKMLKSDGTLWHWYRYFVTYQGYKNEAKLLSTGVKSIDKGFTNIDGTVLYRYGSTDSISDVVMQDDRYFLKSDGSVWAFGSNYYGNLGIGTKSTDITYNTVKVHNLSDIVLIRSSLYAGYAVKSDGTLWAWGNLTNTGSPYNLILSPIQIQGLTDVVDVIPHRYVNYAIKSDGTIWEFIMGGYFSPVIRQVEGVSISSLTSLTTQKDTIAPNLSFEGDFATPTNQNIEIKITSTEEDGSGVKSITLPNGEVLNGDQATFTVSTNGEYLFKTEDNAGNVSEQSITISNIDKIAPTSPTFESTPISISINSGVDNESGVDKVEYGLNGESFSAYSNTLTLPDGLYNIQARTVDKAGNESELSSLQVLLYGEQLQVSKDAVEQAQSDLTQVAVDNASLEIAKLPEFATEKQDLLSDLHKVQEQVTTRAVNEFVSNPTIENYEKSLESLDMLSPDSSLYEELNQQMQDAENNIIVDTSSKEGKEIKLAITFINKAEDNPTKGLIHSAQIKVDRLEEGIIKTKLQLRLNILK